MKTHLNTLFVTTDGAYLCKDGQAVAVRIKKETRLRVPLHNLDGIVCFGRVGVSPQLMGECASQGVSISFLSSTGRFHAAVVGFSPGNVILRRQQYRLADDAVKSALAARCIILGKLANCRTLLLRAARETDVPDRADRLRKIADRLNANQMDVRTATNVERLRGLEGEAAASYFESFNDLMIDVEGFTYTRRSRRPPLDPLNALLSFVYALLSHDARSACEGAGLDAAVGYLHEDRPGRPGMALDLMEEFRPCLADRLVFSLINRRQVHARDFEKVETGAVRMSDSTRKTVLVAYQERKQEVVTHPFLGEKMTFGQLLHIQARLMSRWIRGDLDAYPPYVWK